MITSPPHGWLILDKPLSITSAKAVAAVKKKFNLNKIGHGGTLDPLASGILPLGLGEATKAFQYVVAVEKTYHFTAYWGKATSTDDLEGDIIAESADRPTLDHVRAILPKFTGHIMQRPPHFSAIKVNGKRAYKEAREGKKPEIPAREVHVLDLNILSHDESSTTFNVRCGKGTYVRSLARDMGEALGCFGHVSMLRRVSVGKFTEKAAISLDALIEMEYETALSHLKPVEWALDDIPAVSLDVQEEKRLRHGQPARPMQAASAFKHAPILRCHRQSDGTLIAFASPIGGLVKSQRTLNIE